MLLSCIIIDDEPLAVRLLESYVKKTPELELLASFTDSIKAVNAIKALKPDFKEYAFESYEVNALDFLLKPIRYNKFLAAVEKARNVVMPSPPTPPQQPSTVFIRVDSEWRNVAIEQIVYVSGMKDYVLFYLDNMAKPLVTHLTMKAVEDMLPKDRFLRIHRSYIIAVDKIQKVDRNDCVYIGKEIIHIPDGYQQTFQAFLETRIIKQKSSGA